MTEGDTPTPTASQASASQTGTPPGTPAPIPAMASTATYTPTKPIMGGLQQQSDTTWIPWTGGKPRADWTELEEPIPSVIGSNQYRTNSIGGSTKAEYYRTKGLEDKFSRKGDLLTLQLEVLDHLEKYGLDSIAYLPDPIDNAKMVCVITDHAQFTLKEAKSLENTNQKDKYDMYDKSNIKDAIKFLLNSLDPALKQQMYENCDQERTSFVVYWMNLMQLIGSVSINRFTKIMNRIRARNINEYSGQDVLAMATDFTNDWKTLHSARMFDHNLIMIMLDSIMQGGTEDFRFELRTL